ncbi:MAG: hypothetical protein COX62_00845 [Deltaproteobacteria bacterium CG_4_10_14_0_2_um_filter_43_8]|nr:MAG: hypothetical protein COV43_04320 [Deltaproteobacteria bacterium CG11_big_fil_rev_8_21_14_0_20_42_23]PJA22034.1 MAG: hypothetical protein COX62_00845 [Deltaproteobacteria bacterium CG_4_10_14_0_2_um_filter_43_8]PJC65000.1 MAG: hypothetical protein CO021_00710 [Deltaproteobacteria bacterium CG_4_9_14_0_2_um_filter_42_21]
MSALTEKKIKKLFHLLNEELTQEKVQGELYLVGGAVMCLVFQARDATKDVDAFFEPSTKIRQAAARVAVKAKLDADWLNDSVKGYLSQKGKFVPFLDLSNLKIMVANAEYLLAMKCLAMRIGEEFHDEEDIRYLLRFLNLSSYKKACALIEKYYPIKQFPQKTLYALEEILPEK